MISSVSGSNFAKQIEVEERVVHRRDQRVRRGVAETRERRVVARRVDDDEIRRLARRVRASLRRAPSSASASLLGPLLRSTTSTSGVGRVRPVRSAKRIAILDVARKRPLAAVEVDGRRLCVPARAIATAICIAVVVFPVPPFSLPKTMTCVRCRGPAARACGRFKLQFCSDRHGRVCHPPRIVRLIPF